MKTPIITLSIVFFWFATVTGQTFTPPAGSVLTNGNVGTAYVSQDIIIDVPTYITLTGQQLLDNLSGPVVPLIGSTIDPNQNYPVNVDSVEFDFADLPIGYFSVSPMIQGGTSGAIGFMGTTVNTTGIITVDIASAIYGETIINNGQDTLPLGGVFDPGPGIPIPVDPLANIMNSEGYTFEITNTNNLPIIGVSTVASSNCDGSAEVVVYAGTGPFTYTYSTGQSGSLATVDSLCPGVYSVSVEDSSGATVSTSFIITDAANIYSSLIPLPGDTLFTTPFIVCDLDFNAPIDSFEVTNAYVSGTDTLIAEWLVWQQGSSYALLGYYPNVGGTNVVLSATMFCLNGRSELGSFQLFAPAPSLTAGIKDANEELPLSVFPNPTTSTITLQIETPPSQSWLTDIAGRKLMPLQPIGTQWQADLSALPHGMYLVEVFTEEGKRGVRKVVKE